MPPVGIDQEPGAVLVDGKAEMVRHRFMHVQSRRPPERAGKLRPLLMVWIGPCFLVRSFHFADAHRHALNSFSPGIAAAPVAAIMIARRPSLSNFELRGAVPELALFRC
jgi:hypothetical protein